MLLLVFCDESRLYDVYPVQTNDMNAVKAEATCRNDRNDAMGYEGCGHWFAAESTKGFKSRIFKTYPAITL